MLDSHERDRRYVLRGDVVSAGDLSSRVIISVLRGSGKKKEVEAKVE